MRYRQSQHHFSDRDQQAKALINGNDVLSTSEQDEVIAYFARALRSSAKLLRVIVCLQAMLALVYTLLLLSGSLIIDLSVDMAATASLVQLAQQRKLGSREAATDALSQDPLEARDAEQRTARGKYVHESLHGRTAAGFGLRSGDVMAGLSTMVVLHSIVLLLWAGHSCYVAYRRLTVNVEDLIATTPQDLLQHHPEGGPSAAARSSKPRHTLRHLRQRVNADPAVALYAAAALASLGSLFWVTALVHRQRVTQGVYADLGLESPSVLSLQEIPKATLEYVLAVWQPLFHVGVGLLVRSMLDTRTNLIALSKLKYRFEKA